MGSLDITLGLPWGQACHVSTLLWPFHFSFWT